MADSWSGRVVVITGASSGVGRACVRAFAARGARLGLIARAREGLEAAAAEVCAAGGEAIVCPLDVADASAVERAAEAIEERFGPIDLWINNAVVSVFSPVKQMTAEEYRRVTEVSYLGAVHGTLAALRRMQPRDRGAIIQVGSALSYRAIPLQSAACAAKFALRGFTDALRTELRHDGSRVTVTMVQLPAVNTPHFTRVRTRLPNQPRPLPPVYAPELAASAIVYAAEHPGERELIVGGSALRAILGNKLLPRLADWYLARTGYQAQQTEQPVAPERPDNLFKPLPGDPGAHGPFGGVTEAGSLQLWARLHPQATAALGAGLVGLTTIALRSLARAGRRSDTTDGARSR